MLHNPIKWFAALALCVCASNAFAQDEPAAQPDNDIRTTSAEIRKLVSAGNVQEAVDAIDSAINTAGDDLGDVQTLQMLRLQAGSGFLRKRDNASALQQYEAATEFFMDNMDSPQSRSGLVNASRMLYSLYMRTEQPENAYDVLNKSVELLLAQKPDSSPTVIPTQVSSLLGVLSRLPDLSEKQIARAKKIMDAQLKVLVDTNEKDPQDELTLVALSTALMNAATVNRDNTDLQNQLYQQRESIITAGFKANMESLALASQYSSVMGSKISRTYSDDPDAAQIYLDEAIATLESANETIQPRVKRIVTSLKRLEARITSAKKLLALIGQPAPEFEIDGWANNSNDVSVESLKGKVVLLDFWAIWCGPCIATFPHLRELNDEFHDQGLQIVGATRYYGYRWDEEKDMPIRGGDEEVTPEEEYVAITRFLESHEMKHPSFVTPKETEMQKAFGVTGIPHAVVIDRQGNIRMIKVGSGEANAKAIHEMIKELIAEKAE